jgi:hypothetical protein
MPHPPLGEKIKSLLVMEVLHINAPTCIQMEKDAVK